MERKKMSRAAEYIGQHSLVLLQVRGNGKGTSLSNQSLNSHTDIDRRKGGGRNTTINGKEL